MSCFACLTWSVSDAAGVQESLDDRADALTGQDPAVAPGWFDVETTMGLVLLAQPESVGIHHRVAFDERFLKVRDGRNLAVGLSSIAV